MKQNRKRWSPPHIVRTCIVCEHTQTLYTGVLWLLTDVFLLVGSKQRCLKVTVLLFVKPKDRTQLILKS